MRSSRWMLIGASAVAAGVLMVGMAYATSGVVHAFQANCEVTPGPSDNLPQCTPTPETPSPTPQQRLKTHTPTPTDTETPKTNTPIPTSTQPPPTNTPKAASEAVSVKPPNTGSGSGGSDSVTLWLLALGTAAVALGGGAVLVGVRHR